MMSAPYWHAVLLVLDAEFKLPGARTNFGRHVIAVAATSDPNDSCGAAIGQLPLRSKAAQMRFANSCDDADLWPAQSGQLFDFACGASAQFQGGILLRAFQS